MKRVRRPRDRAEALVSLAELRDALDALEIEPGEDYWRGLWKDEPVDLSGPGAVRNPDPETARHAALNPDLDRARSRGRVLKAFLSLQDPRSCDIAELLGVDRSQVSPRLTELGPGSKAVRYDPPLIRKTGRTRASGPGDVENETWELTERGEQVAGGLS